MLKSRINTAFQHFYKPEARGIRTPDNLIKSQVLYQLSYGHKYSIACYSLNIVTGMGEKVKLFAAFSARKSAAGQLVQEPEA